MLLRPSPGHHRFVRLRRWLAAVLLGVGLLSGTAAWTVAAAAQTGGPRVLAATVHHTITPVIAGYLRDGIDRAEQQGYAAFLVRLDTPGGLDSSMRSIIQDVFAAEVPVIVYISPSGARGASAGALITLAAHVAAMAPGTAIGAATPVGGAGGEDLDRKVVNDAAAYAESIAEQRGRDTTFAIEAVREGRSIAASEALALGVVDVVASSTTELLEAIDGRTVRVGPDERAVVLHTAAAVVDDDGLGLLRTIQQFLADPTVAFLLLSLGTLALIFELASPGIGAGAAVGAACIGIALFGLAILPVDLVGVLFLVLAGILFVVEVLAPGLGLAAVGGALALVMSALFLVRDTPGLEVSVAVVLPSALLIGIATVIAGRLAARVRRQPSATTGEGLLVGQTATVRLVRGRPSVHVAGAWWNARGTGTPLTEGTPVRVVALDGLDLVVELPPQDPNPHAEVPSNPTDLKGTEESP